MKKKYFYLGLILVLTLALAVGCGDNDDDGTEGGADNIAGSMAPYELYEQVCEKVSTLKSVSYTADMDTEIEFSEDDERRTRTTLAAEELYSDDSMDLSMEVKYRGHESVTDYNIYYTDGTAYFDIPNQENKQSLDLDGLSTSNAAITDPLINVRDNKLFKIKEEDMRSVKTEVDDGLTVVQIALKDDKIQDYFHFTADEENSLYVDQMDISGFEIEMTLNDNYLPESVEIDFDIFVSSGEGDASWDYTFHSFDSITEINFPDLSNF